jgi:hypothetical protein
MLYMLGPSLQEVSSVITDNVLVPYHDSLHNMNQRRVKNTCTVVLLLYIYTHTLGRHWNYNKNKLPASLI